MQQKSRTPCGKQAFSLDRARSAAEVRNKLAVLGCTTWSVMPCFTGCGRDIFHLTRQEPRSRKGRTINQERPPSKRARKKARWEKNRQAYENLSIGGWEDDGGALHPRDLED